MAGDLLDEPAFQLRETPEGILECTLRGDLDRDDLVPLFTFLDTYYQTHRDVLFLNDFSQVGDVTLAARWYAAQKVKANRPFIKRSAVFGWPATWRVLGDVFVRVSGRKDVRPFASRDEAVRFLLDEQAA